MARGKAVAVPPLALRSAMKKSCGLTVMTPPPATGMEVATIACKRRARPTAIFPRTSNTWRIRSSGP
jgi:hypothetical protein